ncbi:MAG: pentapeptide repeat-containing protein [Helicobacter sp.]|nr:pentapeptide repeat-containing protein [Helicobacter sp.]
MSDENNETKKKKAPREKIREMFGLSPKECKWENGMIVVKPEEGKKELIIKQNISHILKKCNNKRIKFINCVFKKSITLQQITFKEILYFLNSTFEQEVDFSRSLFEKRVFFSESNFEQNASFEEVIFEHNAYFDETTFKGKANFKQSEFYQNAHFYGTEFEEIPQRDNITMNNIPNFLQIILNGYINLTNTKQLLLNFEQLKSIIDGNNEKEKDELANEFRNTYKNFKNALIKDSNLIDASRFHKMELYAKELELEYKRKEEVKNSKCSDMFKFLLSNGKDFIDEIQLYCYRLTSDHHTNLLMILNNVIFLIALFGIANLVLCLCNKICTTTISPLVEIIVSIIFVSIAICFLFECCKKLIFAIIILIDICALLIICTFQPHFAFVVVLICYMVLIFFVLFGCAICCSDKICACEIKKCIFILSYLITAFMLFSNPSSILPILGKLIENKSTEVCLFVVGNVKLLCYGGNSFASETLNLIYMLFLFLLLFSLQKTARKNTIVPS